MPASKVTPAPGSDVAAASGDMVADRRSAPASLLRRKPSSLWSWRCRPTLSGTASSSPALVAMPANLERHCLKLAGAPVSDGMYTDQELRDALVAYTLYKQDGVQVLSISDMYGLSRVTIHRHAKALDAALGNLGLLVDCSRTEMQQAANAARVPAQRPACPLSSRPTRSACCSS